MERYSRVNPSSRYRELLALYERMHTEGETTLGIPASRTFPGTSLLRHLAAVKRLIAATGAKTVLDYGCGKGDQYRPQRVVVDGQHVADGIAEYWDVDEVRCYDPAYAPHATLPDGRFDGVICTDVLEHCPEQDLPWILDEIFAYAETFVYLNVACFPAQKHLPGGENAHITIRAPEWWQALVEARAAARPQIVWELHAVFPTAAGMTERVVRNASTAAPDAPPARALTEVLVEGQTVRFYTPNDLTRGRAQHVYTKEPITIDWLRSMPEGATFLDVGANIGVYTIFAAIARKARVFAFEPESQNYAVLNENLRLNHLGERVVALCAALSDRASIDRLYLSRSLAGASCHSLGAEVGFNLKPRRAAFAQGTVAFRLDDLLDAGHVPVPQYVKIDVDGFEHRVIRGMQNALRNPSLRSLLVELNPALAEHIEMRAFLEELGYRWDPEQVAVSTRSSGAFAGVAEYVFRR